MKKFIVSKNRILTGINILFLCSVLSISSCTKKSSTLPVVTTDSVTGIERTTAVSGGNITSDGGASIESRGICWSTSTNPTTGGSQTNDGTGSGSFVSNLISLSPNTLYYVRAYATNSVGTSYGNQVSFTTALTSIATLTTTAASSITSTTAVSGGNITSDGGEAVTLRGVCWSTAPNPATSDDTTSNGLGTGIFAGNLTSLSPSTTYYVRSYAINSIGTAYGNQISFATAMPFNAVYIQNMAFNPATITVPAGTTITWTNKDGMAHTVTSDTAIFDSGSIASNGTYSRTFPTAGTFPYHCSIHPSMTATVIVN